MRLGRVEGVGVGGADGVNVSQGELRGGDKTCSGKCLLWEALLDAFWRRRAEYRHSATVLHGVCRADGRREWNQHDQWFEHFETLEAVGIARAAVARGPSFVDAQRQRGLQLPAVQGLVDEVARRQARRRAQAGRTAAGQESAFRSEHLTGIAAGAGATSSSAAQQTEDGSSSTATSSAQQDLGSDFDVARAVVDAHAESRPSSAVPLQPDADLQSLLEGLHTRASEMQDVLHTCLNHRHGGDWQGQQEHLRPSGFRLSEQAVGMGALDMDQERHDVLAAGFAALLDDAETDAAAAARSARNIAGRPGADRRLAVQRYLQSARCERCDGSGAAEESLRRVARAGWATSISSGRYPEATETGGGGDRRQNPAWAFDGRLEEYDARLHRVLSTVLGSLGAMEWRERYRTVWLPVPWPLSSLLFENGLLRALAATGWWDPDPTIRDFGYLEPFATLLSLLGRALWLPTGWHCGKFSDTLRPFGGPKETEWEVTAHRSDGGGNGSGAGQGPTFDFRTKRWRKTVKGAFGFLHTRGFRGRSWRDLALNLPLLLFYPMEIPGLWNCSCCALHRNILTRRQQPQLRDLGSVIALRAWILQEHHNRAVGHDELAALFGVASEEES